MVCSNCGTNNSSENKFCINCGSELTKMNPPHNNICESCGSVNEPANKYCTICGAKLKESFDTKNENAEKTSRPGLKKGRSGENNLARSDYPGYKKNKEKVIGLRPLLITAGVLAVSLVFVFFVNKWGAVDEGEKKEIVEIKSANPLLEAEVAEIASKFVCSCGTCNEESLEVCKCGRAIEERQFIRDYLEKNQNKKTIVIALAEKYGFLKSQYASEYKQLDKSKIFEINKITIPAIKLENIKNDLNKTASFSDRATIYSAFMCNCGKCGIDELKDCNCPHPKGAQEVKKFIDDKISANKYTVQDVIELVNSKYGGKKV